MSWITSVFSSSISTLWGDTIGNNEPIIDWNFTNSNIYIPTPLVFARASLATMYDAAGTLVWCPHNLVARSGDASDAVWSKTGVSVAGTTLTVITAGGSRSINQWIGAVPAGPVTVCLRVRAGASSRVSLGLYSAGFAAATASVQSGPGVVSGTSLIQVTGLSAETQSVIVLRATVPAGGVTVYIYPGGDMYGGNAVGDSVEFDDIRLNVGALQPYYPTTSAVYYGPRLTYDPVTHAALGLLVEEQRTNLLTYSEQIDNAAWSKSGGTTVTPNSTSDPNGGATADTVAFATTGEYAFNQYSTPSALQNYVFSIWLRAASPTTVKVVLQQSGGAQSSTTASVDTTWQRVQVSYTTDGAPTFLRASLFPNANTPTFYAWGAQLEAGAFATSYIPTGAASATRAADVVTCSGSAFSQWFNAAEGTFVCEATAPPTVVGTTMLVDARAGSSTANQLTAYQVGSAPISTVTSGVVSQAVMVPSGTVVAGAAVRIAAAFKVNDCAVAFNGLAPASDSSVVMPVGIDNVCIGASASVANWWNGPIKRVRYWRKRLTNAQLQALTA